MKIKSHRKHECIVSYGLVYEIEGSTYGFSFPCSAKGVVHETEMKPAGLANLAKCRAGEYNGQKVTGPEIVEYVNRYVEPAIGECNDCGSDVELHGFTNTCECGADYNMSGQQLAPRDQWGEETGESLSDILSIG